MLKTAFGCVAALLVAVTVVAADVNVEGVKCVISGGPVDATKSVDYKDAKLFFCCGNCPGAFKADNEDHAMKANHSWLPLSNSNRRHAR